MICKWFSIGFKIILLVIISACGEQNSMNSFKSVRVTKTGELNLSAPVNEVFPLFDPINEKKWAADWDFTAVFPNPAVAEPGFTFTTQRHHDPETVWVLSKLDRENHPRLRSKFLFLCQARTPEGAVVSSFRSDTCYGWNC